MADFKLEEKVAVGVALVVVIGVFVLAGSIFGLEGVLGGTDAIDDSADSLASPEDIEEAFGEAEGSFEF